MGDGNEVARREITFAASDGTALRGEIAIPAACRAGMVVCHPHPQFGGNRFNHVVTALFEALPAAGIATLRFDFRRDFGGGVAEIDDTSAAIDRLVEEVPGVPVVLTGYSFGAVVALATDHDRAVGKVLVAPPLRGSVRAPGVPTLVLTPALDQFGPPDVAEPAVAAWPSARLVVVDGADHFLHGHTDAVVAEMSTWIETVIG